MKIKISLLLFYIILNNYAENVYFNLLYDPYEKYKLFNFNLFIFKLILSFKIIII